MRRISEVIQGNELRLNERIVSSLVSTPHLLRKWEAIAHTSDEALNHIDDAIKILMQSPYYYL